jgi:RimJ/RimL family protein N-acetyltransferase
MPCDVTLRPLDPELLGELLTTAVTDADPREVMPPVAGPPGWTEARRAAFLRFHRARSLAAEPVEKTFAVVVDGEVAGAARLCPVPGRADTVEAGVWIGRSRRGSGGGGAALGRLRTLARADGFGRLLVSTTPDNTAVHRIVAALGGTLVPEGDRLVARLDLTAP